MKKLLAYFTASIYVYLISVILFIFKNEIAPQYTLGIAAITLVVSLILLIINVIMVFITNKKDLDVKLILTFKLIQVPFFILNFLIWCILFVATMFNPLIIVFIFAVILGIIFAFCVMMSTSIYTIAYILHNKVEHKMLHTILQLIFIFDVIDCIYLYKKYHEI